MISIETMVKSEVWTGIVKDLALKVVNPEELINGEWQTGSATGGQLADSDPIRFESEFIARAHPPEFFPELKTISLEDAKQVIQDCRKV